MFAFATALAAQQTTQLDADLTDILGRMQSKDLASRERAFDDLSMILQRFNDPHELTPGYRGDLDRFFTKYPDQADRVKLGLIRLLQTEMRAEKQAAIGSYTEDDGEYVFAVTQIVSDLRDDRAIPALVEAMSHSGVDLLQYGDKALEPVLAQLKNPDALVRAGALRTAARILESKRDKDSAARLDEIIRSSLKDPRPAVRTAAIWEIGCLENKQDYIPVLEQIAKTDIFKLPGKADDGGDGDEFFPVRSDARRALREMQSNKPCRR